MLVKDPLERDHTYHQRLSQLVAAAVESFASKGFRGPHTRDIASAAGMSSPPLATSPHGPGPPGNERVRRTSQVHQDPPRQPLPAGALDTAALFNASNTRTYLAAKYRRIAARRGPVKAIVAVQHAILTAIWNMATNGTLYDDRGADLHPTPPRQSQTPRHPTTPPHGLPRHSRAHRVTRKGPATKESSRQGPFWYWWAILGSNQ